MATESALGTTISTRDVIWAWLVLNPGHTAHEIARMALGKRGPTSSHIQSGATGKLLLKMERAGQVMRELEFRSQQGRAVSVWYAVPGAMTIPEGSAS